jgi:prepilin-type N-terminal cleavage/methylation domain-containing protein
VSVAERRRARGFTLVELAIVVGIIVLLAIFAGDEYHTEIPRRLLFGWYDFMRLNANALQPNGLLIAEAIVCTIILGIGGHYFCRWLWLKMTPDGTAAWRMRWTVTGLTGVLLLFVAGIATIGISHQTAWLFTMKGPMVIDSWGPRFVLPEVLKSATPARDAVAAYFTRTGRLPSSTKEAGVEPAELVTNKHVKAMRIEDAGMVVIELAHKQAPDGVIVFIPTVTGSGLDWKCISNLERIYLPAACRN